MAKPALPEPKIESYSLAEVALLTDAPEWAVMRWCRSGLIPGASYKAGAWSLPARGLFLFLQRRIEPHYSVKSVAGILDLSEETVREYIKQKRLQVVKLGRAASAPVRVAESELRRWINA